MGNCFVTKLKESVNNDSLIKLNTVRFKVNISTVSEDNNIILSYVGNLKVSNNKKLYPTLADAQNDTNGISSEIMYHPRRKTYYLASGEYYIDISKKEDLDVIITGACELMGGLEALNYALGLTQFNSRYPSLYGDLSSLSNCNNLLRLGVDNCLSITGSIESLANISSLIVISVVNTKVVGSINNLGKLRTLETLSLTDTDITGEIVTLCNNMVSGDNPRTTGTLAITCNKNITLNGVIVPRRTTKYCKFGTNLPSGAEYTGNGYAIYETNPNA